MGSALFAFVNLSKGPGREHTKESGNLFVMSLIYSKSQPRMFRDAMRPRFNAQLTRCGFDHSAGDSVDGAPGPTEHMRSPGASINHRVVPPSDARFAVSQLDRELDCSQRRVARGY